MPVLLLDTASLYYRAYFALPESLVSPQGIPVNAVRGTLDTVASIVAARGRGAESTCGSMARVPQHGTARGLWAVWVPQAPSVGRCPLNFAKKWVVHAPSVGKRPLGDRNQANASTHGKRASEVP